MPRKSLTSCPTCKDPLPEYPEPDWTCRCGRCVAIYMGSAGVLGHVGDKPQKWYRGQRWPS